MIENERTNAESMTAKFLVSSIIVAVLTHLFANSSLCEATTGTFKSAIKHYVHFNRKPTFLVNSSTISRGGSISNNNMTTTATSTTEKTTTEQKNDAVDVSTAEEEEYIERRWNNLLQYCTGNWSGSIGWYDAKFDNTTEEDVSNGLVDLIPRENNHQLNMRFQFKTRPNNDVNTADWIVYHASCQGSKDELVLTKYPSDKSYSRPQLTLYVFDNSGIIGRGGREFTNIPVIEHGFWDNDEGTGQRRTVVVTYDPLTMKLNKVCFLQLERTLESNFDVSGFNLDDCDIMTTRRQKANNNEHLYHQSTSLTLEERMTLFESWNVGEYKKFEIVDNQGHIVDTSSLDDSSSDDHYLKPLNCLFGLQDEQNDDNPNILRLALPNGVMIACPVSLKDSKTDETTLFVITMGYKRINGEIQIVELYYSSQTLELQHVQATWYDEKTT